MTLKQAHKILRKHCQISQLARDLDPPVTPTHVILVLKGMSVSERVAAAALARAAELQVSLGTPG